MVHQGPGTASVETAVAGEVSAVIGVVSVAVEDSEEVTVVVTVETVVAMEVVATKWVDEVSRGKTDENDRTKKPPLSTFLATWVSPW